MNYFIEKHDMEIILDALQALHEKVKHSLDTGVVVYPGYPYTVEEIDGLFQSLENSGGEQVDNYQSVKDGDIWTVEKNGHKVTLPLSDGDNIVAEFSSREEADRYIGYVGMLLEQGYQ